MEDMMLTIAIDKREIPLLDSDGCEVKINGQRTALRRKDGYLCYDDHRCQIIDEIADGSHIHFYAKSHGMEGEEHFVLKPTIYGDIDVVRA